MKTKVAIRKVEEYRLDLVSSAIADFLSACGSTRLDNAKTVLIKPNLLGGFAPEKAVTTHPIVVEAVIQYLLKAEKEVWIGDSPGGNVNLEQVWKSSGIKDLADKYPVKLINFAQHGIQEIKINGYSVQLSKAAWEADAIINIGKYKTHGLMAYTGNIKNLYGLVPGLTKSYYHRQYPDSTSFGLLLVALYKAIKHRVAYHILDGIVGMDGNGPSAGRPRKFGLLFGSTSAPALDYLASRFMGFKLNQVFYVKEALHSDGIIPSQIEYPISFNQFKMLRADISVAKLNSYTLKYMPSILKDIFKKLFDFSPVISDRCISCRICVDVCPEKTIGISSNGKPVIHTDNCIRCLCCHEMCPHHAIDIQKSFVSKLLMKNT
jgi:uncharacterized protein (DUF362 family)/NAD-dependent dihydropyrimidine dehydrogenase PreA subunit